MPKPVAFPVTPVEPTKPATQCAMCGSCCHVVGLAASKAGFAWLFATYPEQRANPDQANAVWVVDHFTEVTHEQAAALNFDLVRQMPDRNFYTCDAYDPEARRCTMHETRPPLCRSFPWADGPPNNQALQPHPECSFWADVPRHTWPPGMRPLPSPVENCC